MHWDDNLPPPEAGKRGDAVKHSYTGAFLQAQTFALTALACWDLRSGGEGRLLATFGVGSNWLVVLCLVVALWTTTLPIGTAGEAYRRFTGRVWLHDRIGFARSGGQDVGMWCGLQPFVVSVLLFTYAVPPGALGAFRPFIVLIAPTLLGCFVAPWIMTRVLDALYGLGVRDVPRRDPRRGGDELECQKTFLRGGRCHNLTFRDEEWCRWHKILHEFRADLAKRSHANRQLMTGSFAWLALAGWGLWKYAHTPHLIFIFLAVAATGCSAKLFADGVLARDYPLSQFAGWAKLLAVGMVVEILGEVAFAALIVLVPGSAEPIIRSIGTNPRWITYGPMMLAIAAAYFASTMTRLFLSRIFFRDFPSLGAIGAVASGILIAWAMQPVIKPILPDPKIQQQAWSDLLGPNMWIPIGLAYFVAFNLCEIINVRMRKSRLDNDEFKRTIWPMFPPCYGPPILGTLAARYLLPLVGLRGPVLFVILAVALAAPMCVVMTHVALHLMGLGGRSPRRHAAYEKSAPDSWGGPRPRSRPQVPVFVAPHPLGSPPDERLLASDLPPQMRAALLLNLRVQVGPDAFALLLSTMGEDGLVQAMLDKMGE